MKKFDNKTTFTLALISFISLPGSAIAQDPFPIQFGHSGNWYNPQTPGQGMVFEIVPAQSNDESPIIVVDWMTFTPENLDNDANQRWLFGVATIDGNPVTIPLVLFGDGRLNESMEPFQRSWGSMTVTFHDCTTGHVEFTVPEGPVDITTGSFDIIRLTPNVVCE